MKIKKVTKTEFVLEDGRVYQHPVPLDKVLPLQQFQQIYDHWEHIIKDELMGHDPHAVTGPTGGHQGSQ